MRQQFINKKFRPESQAVIEIANDIITKYAKQGFTLTLRQLYYQFVAGDMLPNTERSYKRLGSIVNDARLAGQIDWDAIEDRTRNLKKNLRIRNPAHAVQIVYEQYNIDMWQNQDCRVEVWIEKEALTGVIEDVCEKWDVPYFACRGYVSQSEQWRAGCRHHDKHTIVLHLGDHDPSGMDMTRDNRDRLSMFGPVRNTELYRIALNMDQIDQYNPPPNPAKMTDSRFDDYRRNFGDDSWELDALEPSVIIELIEYHINRYRDPELWRGAEMKTRMHKQVLKDVIFRLEDDNV